MEVGLRSWLGLREGLGLVPLLELGLDVGFGRGLHVGFDLDLGYVCDWDWAGTGA